MKYAENNGAAYRKDSARTDREQDAWMWISNAFQPPGSRFTAGYGVFKYLKSPLR